MKEQAVWDRVFPFQVGERVRVKSFSTYDKFFHSRLKKQYFGKVWRIESMLGDNVYLDCTSNRLMHLKVKMKDIKRYVRGEK
jgi:hypothetical protein